MIDGLSLSGRTALVTGGTRGIGYAVAKQLVQQGAQVLICGRNFQVAKEAALGLGNSRPYTLDLTDQSAIDAVIAQVLADADGVDILVSNAGWTNMQPFIETEPATWDHLIALNLRAHIQLTRLVLPGMLQRGWGRVIFISSEVARHGGANVAIYAACKAGLGGFAKSVAREVAPNGVTVNVVSPGATDTSLFTREMANNDPTVIANRVKRIPMGRLADASDVSAWVGFLASPRAGYFTGQVVSVSGGDTMA